MSTRCGKVASRPAEDSPATASGVNSWITRTSAVVSARTVTARGSACPKPRLAVTTLTATLGTSVFSGPMKRGSWTPIDATHSTAATIVSTQRRAMASRIIAMTPATARYGEAAATMRTISLVTGR